MKDKILKMLREIPSEGFVGTYGDHELIRTVIDSCGEIVETVFNENQLNDGWIPISKGLPEFTGDYNTTVGVGSELGYFEEVRTYRYEIYNGKTPHKKWIIANNFCEVVNVIAWRPLPKKYTEDEE